MRCVGCARGRGRKRIFGGRQGGRGRGGAAPASRGCFAAADVGLTGCGPAGAPGARTIEMTAELSANLGPRGHRRGVGLGILLFVITLGFYGWYWVFKTQEEMKKHTGEGLGGV